MVKFKWLLNNTLLQRIFLLSISSAITYEILMGYIDYNNKVVEYMESMSYRQARESSRMKGSRGVFSLDGAKSFAWDQRAANTKNE
ncbi:uncharacterized protein [Mycetomoellerius zeteki]|uniref:uncharacterized protein n=1 Tax=Mycetomoellerius zeteki TaxID=64791 RepID=UPI00084E9D2F|nr:PREDICTED: uncharacterized protein LOC108723226 [Trachymyrmex zeteki]